MTGAGALCCGGGCKGCLGTRTGGAGETCGLALGGGPTFADKGRTAGEDPLSDGFHTGVVEFSSPLLEPLPFFGGGSKSLPTQLPTDVDRSGALGAAPFATKSPEAFDFAPTRLLIGS